MTTVLPRRRLLGTAAAGLAVAGLAVAVVGCSPIGAGGPTPRRPTNGSSDPSGSPGELTLVQGQVTGFGADVRIGYVNRFDAVNQLSIWIDQDPASFVAQVEVGDGDVLPVAGQWWSFRDVGEQGGRAALTATPTDAPARPPAATLNLLFADGHAQLTSTSRLEVAELTTSQATIKRWTGTYSGEETDPTELITLKIGDRIDAGTIAITAERFQPTSSTQRGYVAFSSGG